MAGIEKRLKDRELLLLVASAAGGILDGRTVAQKLLYFAGRRLEQPTGHTAYFFGPYSDDCNAALQRSVLADELSERIERIPDWGGGPDAMKHTYTLTDRGKEEAERIAAAKPEEAEEVLATVGAIVGAVPGLRQSTLSAAAKIDLIVSEEHRVMPPDEIRELASALGWRLSQNEVDEALNVLTQLDLVEVRG
jgi:hypothetical protein